MDVNMFLSNEEIKQVNPKNTININIGVLGHIDSGKTSLARVLTKVFLIYLIFRFHLRQVWTKILKVKKEE